MSVTTAQDFRSDGAELRPQENQDPQPEKAAVERYRKRFHALAWPAFFLTVLLTKSSIEGRILEGTILIASYALVTAGTAGRLWCGLYLRGQKSKNLRTDGPYSVCRNPLYLFTLVGIVGIALASKRVVVMTVFPLLFAAFYLSVIRAEEARLPQIFGRTYEDYCRSVPRLLPRLSGYSSPASVAVNPERYVRGIVKCMGQFGLLVLLQFLTAL